jgi:hypothetical protein
MDPHAVIWSALSKGRTSESVPLVYNLTGADEKQVVPVRKFKEQHVSNATEEEFVPPGIWKTNWINKHKNVVPAVVVVFFDLEWGAEDWEKQQAECAATINDLREQMRRPGAAEQPQQPGGRPTKLVAILLQKETLAEGNPLVEERAVSLRVSRCTFDLHSPQRQCVF